MAHPDNSGSVQRILLKFCRMREANSYIHENFIAFREKNLFGAI